MAHGCEVEEPRVAVAGDLQLLSGLLQLAPLHLELDLMGLQVEQEGTLVPSARTFIERRDERVEAP